jgi:hypothetical protein
MDHILFSGNHGQIFSTTEGRGPWVGSNHRYKLVGKGMSAVASFR